MYLTYIVKDHNDALLPLHVTRSRLISLSKLKDKHKDTVMQLIAFYSWDAEIPNDKSNSAFLKEETFPNEGTPIFL